MLAPNTVLQNRYLIVRLLAQGGMGAVYLAKDQRLRSDVALKETYFADDRLLKAFEREALLLADLHHSVLPKVTDYFTESGGYFLVMQYIPGDDLGSLLESKGIPFSPDDVLRWADQLLDALDYLHSHEPPIIHRDIKPQNLKLTKRGQIVLLDFGLAKGATSHLSRMQMGSSVFGYTPAYAPPEQIEGAGTDSRSDLYSLGASLYHLMTGAMPISAMSRATAILSGQPDPLRPVNELNPHVSEAIAIALMQSMALNRDSRPSTAIEMRKALNDATRTASSLNTSDHTEIGKISPVEGSSKIKSLPICSDAFSPLKETATSSEVVTVSDAPMPENKGLKASLPAPIQPAEVGIEKRRPILTIGAIAILLVVSIFVIVLMYNQKSPDSSIGTNLPIINSNTSGLISNESGITNQNRPKQKEASQTSASDQDEKKRQPPISQPLPKPSITLGYIQPQSVVAGTPRRIILTIVGQGLPVDAQILFDGRPKSTRRVNNSTLSTDIEPTEYASPRSIRIEVKSQSDPANLFSNTVRFIIQSSPEPPFKFIGYLKLGNWGLFEMNSNKQISRLTTGDTVQGWRIDSISEKEVEITHLQYEIKRRVPMRTR
jgi:serine/threonine protein kinase